ncbi:uncharacterized protein LOC108625184 isoform X1 [Ceratina calcarata]|nr:uncharacterized protein LOC108625184 isoform X1 [Ceratina calcarata]
MSIDSVNRPFHPSDWVDVNLEVPSTPTRPGSALTNLIVDTSPCSATTPTSSCSNLKDVTPIPPPRRRKRNKGRPLPPKPDEVGSDQTSSDSRRIKTCGDEPLYSSVRSPKTSENEHETNEVTEHRTKDDEAVRKDGRRVKEIYEHKVNGTGRIISSDVVSGRRSIENSQHQRNAQESEEYERFARSRTSWNSSTPNREEKRGPIEKQIRDSTENSRSKNYSTVSLPNYDELDTTRHRSKDEDHDGYQAQTKRARRPVRSSTGSLPAESFLSPFSEKTSVRLEDYIPRSDNLSPYQLLENLDASRTNGTVVRDEYLKYDPSKSEDWELADIDNCELNHRRRPSFERINEEDRVRGEDVVDFSGREDASGSPLLSTIYLEKPESFGKTASPVLGQPVYAEVDPNRSHLRYFEPPMLTDNCKISTAPESVPKEPFFLDEAKHRAALDTISEGRSDRPDQSRTIFARSPSNESEPSEEAYETKELQNRAGGLIKTISEESLPREMLEEDVDEFFDEKHAKDEHNKLRKSLDEWKTSTPPPSPEPRIKPEIQDSDHSTLLKVLKEEAADGSNLSSMTPSLNELEAALSDMLEKEDSQEGFKEAQTNGANKQILKKLESETKEQSEANKLGEESPMKANSQISGVESDQNLVGQSAEGKSEVSASLKQILDMKAIGRKISFCSWEESVAKMESPDDQLEIEVQVDSDKDNRKIENVVCPTDIPPEKPSRLNRSLEDVIENTDTAPTPPRRRNRSHGMTKRVSEVTRNGSVITESLPNDRLI